jgi:hypothetical protein
MKLRQITPGAYYLPSATNLGVVATPDSGAVLIDTGQDADQARRLLKACEAIGLTPRAIINTHAMPAISAATNICPARPVPPYVLLRSRKPSLPTLIWNLSTSSAAHTLSVPCKPHGS